VSELALEDLRDLPSPFYRVAGKALIFDDQQRLLLVFNGEGNPELPGGGWEHGESLEDCIRREIDEELGVGVRKISSILFSFRAQSRFGWHTLRLVVWAELASSEFQFGDGMQSARFVTREELLGLDYVDPADAAIKTCVDQIWPA